jgi:hypothetical protein
MISTLKIGLKHDCQHHKNTECSNLILHDPEIRKRMGSADCNACTIQSTEDYHCPISRIVGSDSLWTGTRCRRAQTVQNAEDCTMTAISDFSGFLTQLAKNVEADLAD